MDYDFEIYTVYYLVKAFFWQSSTFASGDGVAKSNKYFVTSNFLIFDFSKKLK